MPLRKWINVSHIIRMASDSNETTTNLVLKMSDVENNVLITNVRPADADSAYYLYQEKEQVDKLIEQIGKAKPDTLIEITAIKAENKPKPKPKQPETPAPNAEKTTVEKEEEPFKKRKAPSMAHLAVEKTDDIE